MSDSSLSNTASLLLLIVSASLVPRTCDGYAQYRERIPNGLRVPHPCKPGHIWRGVGHEILQGGGPRNPFGLDFAANGRRWTTALCHADSDGDGRTNGEELGDPDCTWREGMISENRLTVSHPAICDPHESAECQARNWDFCDQTDEFECDAIKQPDVINIALRFNRTQVPVQVTSYFCMMFDLDDYLEDDDEYHLIAMKPDIDNVDVLHHAVITTCFKGAESFDFESQNSPVQCGMNVRPICGNLLGIWTLGLSGNCVQENVGYVITKKLFSKFAIQLHYNNPLLVENYWDGSGIILYLTKNKRRHNAGMMVLGNDDFEIPPRQKDVVIEGHCSSRCTRLIVAKPIYFLNMLNHMHYLGKSAYTEHRRNNTLLSIIGNEPDFNYDDPKLHQFTPQIEFLPGDELITYCHYSSIDSEKYTYFGDATSDEMCYSFIAFYPRENMDVTACNGYRSLDRCSYIKPVITDGCNYGLYTMNRGAKLLELMAPVIQECRVERCRPECQKVVDEVRKHPCMRGDMGHFMKNVLSMASLGPYMNMLAKLSSCDVEEACPNAGHRFQSQSQTNDICDVDRFLNVSNGELDRVLGLVLYSQFACLRPACQQNCAELIKKAREHPCLHGEAGEMMDASLALMSKGRYKDLYTNLHKCDVELLCEEGQDTSVSATITTTQTPPSVNPPSNTLRMSLSIIVPTSIGIVAFVIGTIVIATMIGRKP